MRRRIAAPVVFGMLLAFSPALYAQSNLQTELKDGHIGEHWIYDDFPKALMQAKESGKPIMALFR